MLNHVNAYTGRLLKDEPNLLFVEMINEPIHHPENLQQSVDYINTLVDAVKSTGAPQITFHNFSQDFKIGDALAQSKVEGIDFGWYPSGLVAGHEQKGNFLQAVDNYAPMLDPRVAAKPRIVYEFDQADMNTGYMFPAMARTYRSVGAQFAAIFAYDMLETAPYNLGWQTHFINLVHTPRQAVSAVIAGEAMRRLPRKSWPAYPDDSHFGDFSVDYASDSSALNAPDAYMYAGDFKTPPVNPAKLTRVVGFGSSPVVDYEGTGAYFLDKVRDGVWRLEVYPDELLASDPFAQPQLSKIVSRLYFRNWPMTVQLADLGAGFHVMPLTVPSDGAAAASQANGGTFQVEPGVWLLTKADHVDPATLPAMINRVGLREYHVNAPQTYPDLIQIVSPDAVVAGQPINIRVRVASQTLPQDLVALYPQARHDRLSQADQHDPHPRRRIWRQRLRVRPAGRQLRIYRLGNARGGQHHLPGRRHRQARPMAVRRHRHLEAERRRARHAARSLQSSAGRQDAVLRPPGRGRPQRRSLPLRRAKPMTSAPLPSACPTSARIRPTSMPPRSTSATRWRRAATRRRQASPCGSRPTAGRARPSTCS